MAGRNGPVGKGFSFRHASAADAAKLFSLAHSAIESIFRPELHVPARRFHARSRSRAPRVNCGHTGEGRAPRRSLASIDSGSISGLKCSNAQMRARQDAARHAPPLAKFAHGRQDRAGRTRHVAIPSRSIRLPTPQPPDRERAHCISGKGEAAGRVSSALPSCRECLFPGQGRSMRAFPIKMRKKIPAGQHGMVKYVSRSF